MMATTMLPDPTMPPMPADTLVALHQRNASSYAAQILTVVADCETGVQRIDAVMDCVPDVLEAIREQPFSTDAITQLHAFCEQVLTNVQKLRDAASHMAKLRQYGTKQVSLMEARLAEVRSLSEDGSVFGDESTAYADAEDVD